MLLIVYPRPEYPGPDCKETQKTPGMPVRRHNIMGE